MFEYDYEIFYKRGKDNVVAYALSKKFEDEGSLFSLSSSVPDWIDVVKKEWLTHPMKSQHI